MNIERFLASAALPSTVLVPLGAAFLVLVLGRLWKGAGRVLSVVAPATTLLLTVFMMAGGTRGLLWAGGWDPLEVKGGLIYFSKIGGVALCADGLSLLMLALIGAISALVAFYAASYMASYTANDRFCALFLLMIAGMNGCVVAGDLFNFFVFLEVASITSYALVGFGTESEELEAAFKYLVLGSVASSFLLFGIALVWGAFGTLNMAQLAAKVRDVGGLQHSPVALLATVMFVLGLGLKAALVPFHSWLPDAHPSAPAPISAMLSGLLIKALGMYAVARIFLQVLDAGSVRSLGLLVLWLGVLSMVVGVLMAVGQWDFKRLLAYHSISQMGYVAVGLGLAMVLTLDLRRIDQFRGREAQLVRQEKDASDLRVKLSISQPTLEAIDEGMLDRETAGPEGVKALRNQVAGFQKDLAAAEKWIKATKPGLDREREALAKDVGRFARISTQPDRLGAARLGLKAIIALALLGAIFHLVNHAFFKSLLFLCAGAIEQATGTRNLKELGGLWSKMPYTSTSCAVAALSISGVPPFNGFWSKLLIIWAAALAGHWGLAGVTVLVSFLTLVSFVKVQKYALFGPMSARVLRGAREVPWPMCFSMVMLAAGCLLLGVLFMFNRWVPDLVNPAVEALGGGPDAWRELLLKPLGLG